MNKEMKELNAKSNEEICALIARLNSQLLESRFKMAVGEVEKTHLLSQIRKTIARCMYMLNTRGFTISVGSHGIYLIDKKTNKITNMTDLVKKFLTTEGVVDTKKVEKKIETKQEEKQAKTPTKKSVTKKDVTKESTTKKETK